ncbi:hypothetical protein [Fluviispira multicolorata]|uniref:Dihydroorotate dehydrogenase catalytic domain-containing protein n=1 Tax=Fluviispira multicolorata TaxID=2654512 RepID=A0A833JGZ6_9BACT|nr:hypothetical protein [Fluviispira multicolorata]KAB8033207.1 hypothetical protein GCL57_00485 [Fluviispira multicolorata]
MYNSNASYEENYKNGPDKNFLKDKHFPKIQYLNYPKYEFLGIPFHIPFGVAAGPLLNTEYVKVALNAGFCMPVYKTVRSAYWECNKWPNILSIKADKKSLFADESNNVIGEVFNKDDYNNKNISISNSFGVPSQSVSKWQEDFDSLSEYSQKNGYHVSLSFQGSRHENSTLKETRDYFFKDILNISELSYKCINLSGFSILELNLSCPNEAHAPLYKDIPSALATIQHVHQILSTQKAKVKLVVKVGVLNQEEIKIFLAESAGKIDAISAINTISANITQKNGYPALGSGALSGGVCGSLIFEQGKKMVSLISETREKLGITKKELGIIGVGGVVSQKEFDSYLSCGADMVHAATGMMWNLELASEIATFLRVPFQKLEK